MRTAILIFLGLCVVSSVYGQTPIGTAFTYQGRLTDAGNPANGNYDFEFRLFDSATGTNQIGSVVSLNDLSVSSGLFSTTLDFGSAFGSSKRWLEIRVRPGASTSGYTLLFPLQELTPAPNALFASSPIGDITSVLVGAGLVGGAATGDVSLAAAYAGSGGDFGVSDTLARADHAHDARYPLSAGKAGGQTLTGGTSIGENLILRASASASPGNVILVDNGGRVGIQEANPSATLDVGGEIRHNGVIKVGSNPPTTYEVSELRYIVDAPPSSVGITVTLDSALTDQLCRDRDGCEVTLQMINWDSPGQPGAAASRTDRLFISETSRWWRFSNIDITGLDNNALANDFSAYDCYFSDAETYSGAVNGRNDSGIGFGLLNLAGGNYSDATTTCRVIIID